MTPALPAGQLQARQLGWAVPQAGDGQRWVLRGLDLNLPAGSQTVLLGPSGAGKSSLLHLLAGLALPHEGQVQWGDDRLSGWPAARREAWRRSQLGLVFQQFHLFAQLSALDNTLLPWTFDHLRLPPSARADATSLLRKLGVAPHTRCGLLSRGEQQRVALARALVRQPRVVLADEPTASLDAHHALATCLLLKSLCREQGSILLLATHDPQVAAQFDRRLDLASTAQSA
jgi:putative ABC transport system ATP-binding protein